MNLARLAIDLAQVTERDIVAVCDDDPQAQLLTSMMSVLAPVRRSIFVPASDALPGDTAPPSPENSGRRVAALRSLRALRADGGNSPVALFMSGEAAAQRFPPPETFDQAPPTLSVGAPFDATAFAETVAQLGYVVDDRVDEPGEVALRGDVIDIFPADAGSPARLEIAADVIHAIRAYDPITQRTTQDIERLEIGRASEPEVKRAVTILDHLTEGVIVQTPRAEARRQRLLKLALDNKERASGALDAIGDSAWSEAAGRWQQFALAEDVASLPRYAEARSPIAAFALHAAPLLAQGHQLILAGHERDLRYLRPRLARRLDLQFSQDIIALGDAQAAPAIAIEMPCDAGFLDERLLFVSAADIIGSRALKGEDIVRPVLAWGSPAAEVHCGDVVIHEDHGVARVLGLEKVTGAADLRPAEGDTEQDQTMAAEMIALQFARDARRLVAVEDADRIWRYGADADAVTLDSLNGGTWAKRRAEIARGVADSAQGLSELAARRATLKGPIIQPDAAAYERFVRGFAFNETADQARAIEAVRDDLGSGRPMDRLIVGDVGYGKTEVALRAAALVALAGHQVAVAAPTTVLVRQHLETFVQRFADTGLTVAGLSRLSSAAERKAVKAGLADGSIAIVIGTGAVMAKGVRYKDLALVVIDEEQRFGAADKTKLRGSGERHLLSLSATPIPRTLQMALVGLQEISLITTPPAHRQPIRTSLDSVDQARIRTALLRERGRGGQSFVVVPRIEDMARVGDLLRRAAPELEIIEAHGKLPVADIDAAMVAFAGGRGDILLATNIIEAGLDVPRANTMIVWRADRFGLAQLHQLRGRVGRGNRRGQILLLTEDETTIAPRTLKRLRTLAAFDRLGAGFDISAQDMDMRGSGDLLGETQAGHVKLIGTDLYQHLLGQSMRAQRGESIDEWRPELNLGASGTIPESWVPEADIRLSLYVRLARLVDEAAIDAFEEELIDRFGPLPASAELLLALARIRVEARALAIARIDAGPAAIALTPRRNAASDWAAAGLVRKNDRLLLKERTQEGERAARVQALLETLASARP